jgi:hypothetical protein
VVLYSHLCLCCGVILYETINTALHPTTYCSFEYDDAPDYLDIDLLLQHNDNGELPHHDVPMRAHPVSVVFGDASTGQKVHKFACCHVGTVDDLYSRRPSRAVASRQNDLAAAIAVDKSSRDLGSLQLGRLCRRVFRGQDGIY